MKPPSGPVDPFVVDSLIPQASAVLRLTEGRPRAGSCDCAYACQESLMGHDDNGGRVPLPWGHVLQDRLFRSTDKQAGGFILPWQAAEADRDSLIVQPEII